jgi:hypothetical protein
VSRIDHTPTGPCPTPLSHTRSHEAARSSYGFMFTILQSDFILGLQCLLYIFSFAENPPYSSLLGMADPSTWFLNIQQFLQDHSCTLLLVVSLRYVRSLKAINILSLSSLLFFMSLPIHDSNPPPTISDMVLSSRQPWISTTLS